MGSAWPDRSIGTGPARDIDTAHAARHLRSEGFASIVVVVEATAADGQSAARTIDHPNSAGAPSAASDGPAQQWKLDWALKLVWARRLSCASVSAVKHGARPFCCAVADTHSNLLAIKVYDIEDEQEEPFM